MRRIIPIADQRRRAKELDDLRLSRPLTDAEAAEADNLAHRLYLRERRARLAAMGIRR